MLFGILSAIALGIGITATAQDLIREEAAAQQGESGTQIEEVRRPTGTENPDSELLTR